MYTEMTSANKILKVKEVAETLSISISMVYKVIESGELPALRIGNLVRVRLQDLNHFVQTHLSTEPSLEE
jgi:excisionase family DNA binding protein